MARPTKPHHQSWNNKAVPGLTKTSDGRWRVRIGGKDIKFTATERQAVDKHWQLQQEHAAPAVSIPLTRYEKKAANFAGFVYLAAFVTAED